MQLVTQLIYLSLAIAICQIRIYFDTKHFKRFASNDRDNCLLR